MKRHDHASGAAEALALPESVRERLVALAERARSGSLELAGVGSFRVNTYHPYPPSDPPAPPKRLPFFAATPAMRAFVNGGPALPPAPTDDPAADALAAQIVSALVRSDSVEVVGFGTFEVRARGAENGLTFVASLALKQALDPGNA